MNDFKNAPILKLPWRERFTVFGWTFLLFLALVAASLPALSGAGRELDYWANLRRFAGKFFPPDFSVAPQLLTAVGETIQIAVLATAAAVVLALPLAVAGARTTAPRWLNLTTRMILNLVRTLPSLIWALLAVAVVGANNLAGVIALTFYSLGYLGKFFSDALESVDTQIPDALRQTGADRVQAFQYGLLPQFKPLILSYALWMLEYNIRSAAIIGYVGAGGIGLLLHTYQEFGEWQKFCTVLIFILIVVTVLDFAGEWLRGKLTK